MKPAYAEAGPLRVLASPPPDVTAAQATAAAWAHYGFEAKAAALRSERDQNFLLETDGGARYVLKLSNGAEDPGVARFQTRALVHVAEVDPSLPVPRVVPTREGALEFGWSPNPEDPRTARLVTYLPGLPLADTGSTHRQVEAFGGFAARLGRALRGFFDPAAGHELLWDLKHAARLADLLAFIESDADRQHVADALGRFEAHVAPRLKGLRAQVIHNDLNPHNVLVDPGDPERICGIIDFGDMVHGALIGDVAIALAYLLGDGPDPIESACRFVAAYHAVTPLEPEEVRLLPDLIATRHALTCAISAWRARRHPENEAYIVRNRGAATRGIEAIASLGHEAVARRFLTACGLG